MALREARLSNIVEGVEATLAVYGRSVKVVVTAEALQTAFVATEEPASWLAAFETNAAAIEVRAREALPSAKNTIVLQRL